MGCERNVGFNRFPRQGSMLGKEVWVCFDYDATNMLFGEVVRDDVEEPYRMIFKLEDGRYVLATECQYTLNQFHEEKQPEAKNLVDAILDLQKRLDAIERTMEYNAEIERNRQDM